METETRPCDVCVKLDGDATPKLCGYCSVCNAWMCETCIPDIPRRTRAFGLKVAEKVKEKLGFDTSKLGPKALEKIRNHGRSS
jgi:hypothetical protein